MANLTGQTIMDEFIRGVASAAVYRAVWERKPVFSSGTINMGMKLAGVNIVYSVAKPVIVSAVPQIGNLLPNGN